VFATVPFSPRPRLAEAASLRIDIEQLKKDLAHAKSQRQCEQKEKLEAIARAEKAEKELEDTEPKRNKVAKIKTDRTFNRRSAQVADELARHHPEDLPRLTVAALKRVAKKSSVPMAHLVTSLVKSKAFTEFRKEIYA
jgi:hypothetical protein